MKTDITEHIGKPVFEVRVPRGEDGRWTPQMLEDAPPCERISKYVHLKPGDYMVRVAHLESADYYFYHRIKSISEKQVSIYREALDTGPGRPYTGEIIYKTAVFRRIRGTGANNQGDVYYRSKSRACLLEKCYLVPPTAKT